MLLKRIVFCVAYLSMASLPAKAVTKQEMIGGKSNTAATLPQRFAYQAEVTMGDGRVRSYTGNSPLLDGMAAATSMDGMGLRLVPHRKADGVWEFVVEFTESGSQSLLQKNVITTDLASSFSVEASSPKKEINNAKVAHAVTLRVSFPRAQ